MDSLKAVLVLVLGAGILLEEGRTWIDGPRMESSTRPAEAVVGEARLAPPCYRPEALGGPVRRGSETWPTAATPPPLALAAYREPPQDPFVIPRCATRAPVGGPPPTAP